MKRVIFLLAVMMCFGYFPSRATEDSAYVEGRKIMEDADARSSCQFETTNVRMEIIESRGTTRIRRLMVYKREAEDGSWQILIRFTAPEDVKRTGLLTIERKGKEADQWLYLPILKKNKRIAEGSKRNSFVGTDFTFEDLRPEDMAVHNYELIKEESLEGNLCFVIKSTPAAEEEKYSGYQSRMIWIRKDIYVPVKIEYADTKGLHIKTETRTDIVEVRKGLWRANSVLMENLQKGQKTVLSVSERDIQARIPESKFTQIELEQGWE